MPSKINALMRQGYIDVGPASSIEYIRNPHLYDLVEGHCISAQGQVMSIILYSTVDIERLNAATILTTAQSETSTALLNIILERFYGLDCSFIDSDVPLNEGLSTHPAYLLIGDNALLEHQRLGQHQKDVYAYDLSTIWYEHTGEPFVYALWIAQKGLNSALIEGLMNELDRARSNALANLHEIAVNSPYASTLSVDMLYQYWKIIGYELGDSQKRGLRLFEQYLQQLKK